jgi:hypothetical protein
MAFKHSKKVNIGSFIKARIRIRSQTSGSGPRRPDLVTDVRIRSQTSGSRSDHKGPDPTGSGSATLPKRISDILHFYWCPFFSQQQKRLVGKAYGSRMNIARMCLYCTVESTDIQQTSHCYTSETPSHSVYMPKY